MDSKKLITADYLDIIYDKRNKNYGGYELRRHYDRRLRKATVLVLTGVAALFCFSFITSNRGGNVLPPRLHPDTVSVVIMPVHPLEKPKVDPPPAQPVAKQIKTKTSVAPVIAPNDLVPPDKQMPENKDMANVQPGPADQDGDPTGIVPGPVTGNGTGVGEIGRDKSSVPVRLVQQMPEFIGDMGAYLSKNLHYPELARSTGIEGRVAIEFVVNEDGSVSNAKVVRGIGGGCDEEALRIVSNMPKWKPGKQNGIAVKVFFVLPILFQLN
ncbi:MAG: TonB family protein [Legionellales bacterium]